jgi:hypothetical protein
MRGTLIRRFSLAAAMGLGICTAAHASSQIYAGNGATGFGGPVGQGSVTFSDDGATVTATFTPGPAGFSGNDLVVYIDSVAGGFADNSTFFDNGDGGREAISGANTGNPSQTLVSFPAGFGADFALSIEDSFASLFQLASGGNNSFTFVTGQAQPNGGSFSVNFPISDLGIAPGGSFSFVGTFISESAYRSNETIGASLTIPGTSGDTPNAGFIGQTLFSSADTYTTSPVPEPASLGLLSLGGLTLLRRRRAE